MNKTVIMLTIFLTFGFTSSGVLANSGTQSFVTTGSGGGLFPPDKSPNAVNNGNRQVVVYGSGGGAFPPDKDNTITTSSLCLLNFCLSLGN